MLWAKSMIERRDTPRVHYRMVYGTDSESLDDEGSLLETTATAIPLILTPTPAILAAATLTPPSTTVTPTLSAPPALEEHLAYLKEG